MVEVPDLLIPPNGIGTDEDMMCARIGDDLDLGAGLLHFPGQRLAELGPSVIVRLAEKEQHRRAGRLVALEAGAAARIEGRMRRITRPAGQDGRRIRSWLVRTETVPPQLVPVMPMRFSSTRGCAAKASSARSASVTRLAPDNLLWSFDVSLRPLPE